MPGMIQLCSLKNQIRVLEYVNPPNEGCRKNGYFLEKKVLSPPRYVIVISKFTGNILLSRKVNTRGQAWGDLHATGV
jgi:hypothetical protein